MSDHAQSAFLKTNINANEVLRNLLSTHMEKWSALFYPVEILGFRTVSIVRIRNY
jgi:hypothetical protein